MQVTINEKPKQKQLELKWNRKKYKKQKEPTDVDSFCFLCKELIYAFKASAPPTISKISLVMAA